MTRRHSSQATSSVSSGTPSAHVASNATSGNHSTRTTSSANSDTPPTHATSSTKLALVTDWLTTPGGAEKVLLELHHMYPDAPIYTSQYRPQKIDWFKDAQVKTGWLNLFPAALRKILGPLRQLYFSHLDLSAYDLVISVTGAEAKAIKCGADTTHLCYCHVPTQYYWQLYDTYVKNPGFGILNPLVRFFFKLFVRPLRRADYGAAQRPDQFITISTYAATQISKYYHRDSLIVAPPVDTYHFSTKKLPLFHQKTTNFPPKNYHFSTTPPELIHKKSTTKRELSTKSPSLSTEQTNLSTTYPQTTPDLSTGYPQVKPDLSTTFPQRHQNLSTRNPQQKGNYPQNPPNFPPQTENLSTIFPQLPPEFSTGYYLIACRQVTWKCVNLAIEACKKTRQPLLVVGDGPEHQQLVTLAADSPFIHFLPWQSTSNLAALLHHARAFLFPSLEPFGIAPVEALAAGCPVIAFAEGGSRDFIREGENGLFFSPQTAAALAQAIERFNQLATPTHASTAAHSSLDPATSTTSIASATLSDPTPTHSSLTLATTSAPTTPFDSAAISASAALFDAANFRSDMETLVNFYLRKD